MHMPDSFRMKPDNLVGRSCVPDRLGFIQDMAALNAAGLLPVQRLNARMNPMVLL